MSTKDKSDHEVGGFEVWFVKKGFEKQQQYYRSFPTSAALLVGIFPMQVTMCSGQPTPANPLKLGSRKMSKLAREPGIDRSHPTFVLVMLWFRKLQTEVGQISAAQ